MHYRSVAKRSGVTQPFTAFFFRGALFPADTTMPQSGQAVDPEMEAGHLNRET